MALLAEASCSPTAAAECVDNRFSYYMSLGMVTSVNLSQLLSASLSYRMHAYVHRHSSRTGAPNLEISYLHPVSHSECPCALGGNSKETGLAA